MALPANPPPVDTMTQRAAGCKGLLLDPTKRVYVLTNSGKPADGEGNGWLGTGSMVIDFTTGTIYMQTGPITATTFT